MLIFFYSIKIHFGHEEYLGLNISRAEKRKLAEFRTSSHQYNIKTEGTGSTNSITPYIIYLRTYVLNALPYFDPVIEDKTNVLRTCIMLYEDLRHNFN